MKFLALAFLGLATAFTPVMRYTKSADIVPGEYVFQYKADAKVQFQDALTKLKSNRKDMSEVSVWEFGDFLGFSAKMDEDELFRFQTEDEGIMSIEHNIRFYAIGSQSPATWGIDRSDQRSGRNNVYMWRDNAAGQNVSVFVLDTGILTTHSNFGGRASFGADCTGSSCVTGSNPQDPQGHGTHCAGTVMSNTYGIAKSANSVNIRVLGSNGSGTTAGIINGINFVVSRYSGKRVISMSLGGGISTSLDNAVNSAFNSGVLSIVAAGNSNNNACNGSPARANRAFTVAASDSNDNKASFSSYGNCVQIWAPGVSIQSTSRTGGTATMSGTSMACPHVAGAAALIHSRGSYSATTVWNTLISEGTPNVIGGNPSGTPNLLLFTNP